jgi:cytochrome c peroxidase
VPNPFGLSAMVALAGLSLAGAIGVIADDATPSTAQPTQSSPSLSAVAALGARLFYDPSLSSSGKLACSSCHDPATAYAPNNALAVQLGGPDLKRPGIRAVPSLGYMNPTPVFSIGPESLFEVEQLQAAGTAPAAGQLAATPTGVPKARSAAAAVAALVPEGGFFLDGRADTLQEQTLGPLLSPFEMDNTDAHTLFEKLTATAYASDFRKLFGASIFSDEKLTLAEASFALARYEIEEPSFHPFTSKYDAYLRGTATLSPDEAAGLKLFDDAKKGNCSSCHLDKVGGDGQMPNLTDFEYEGLGVPRNAAIPANADPHYYDLGICGPMRTDSYAHQSANCALFKTPTLRNVATRHAFFHNGVYNNLEDVLHFYVGRDTDPEKFYPRAASGQVETLDDAPWQYRHNIDVVDAPLDRHPGDRPALNDREIDQVIAFLKTLTDGYRS